MQEDQEGLPEAQDFWIFGYGSLIWKPPPHYDQRVPGWVEGYVRRFWQESHDHRGTPEFPGRVVTLISKPYYALLDDPDPEPAPEESPSIQVEDDKDEAAARSDQGGRVWGAAYHIPKEHAREALEYLDVREQNGYSMERAIFFPSPPTQSAAISKQLLGNLGGSSVRAEAHHLSDGGHGNQDPFICLVYIGLPSNPQFLGPQELEALAKRIFKSKGPSGENREYLYELHTALDELGPGSGDRHISDLVDRCRRLEKEAFVVKHDV